MANRLADSTSPYLLQHAGNPVDWYPWGEEAFEKARGEDKPIFLSIGYSTCHWCHVMEHESFEDEEVAAALNASFVTIKVDREQMPEVDHYYMAVTQALTGRGGWPNTILMTRDKKPFYAGTYFPKAHLLSLLAQVAELWHARREELLAEGDQISEAIRGHLERTSQGAFEPASIEKGAQSVLARFDPANGGFSGAPKFPSPANVQLLLRSNLDSPNERKIEAVRLTLEKMRLGGVYDQLGFGFHRYSTDAIWRIPHFEKMLYDQAGLALAYLEAFQATGEPLFRQTVEEILTYVDRDLSDPAGGFHSAEDADSEGEEGKFYLWTAREIEATLGPEDGALACEAFRVSKAGNYRDEATGRTTGESVLERAPGITDPARFERARRTLFGAREKRVRPFKDDKVLADWNGMAIAAFARAGAVLDEPNWTRRAQRAADFLLQNMIDESGRPRHQFRNGKVEGEALLDDYAQLALGLSELYQACFDPKYLARAKGLAEAMIEELWDTNGGGFFLCSSGKVPARAKVGEDSAYPSGNAAAALALAKLARLTGDPKLEEKAKQTVDAFGKDIRSFPEAYVGLLIAADLLYRPGHEVVIAGGSDPPETQEMIRRLRTAFAPRAVFLCKEESWADMLAEVAPATKGLIAVDGKATAYVCRGFACELPTTDVEQALAMLET